MLQWTNLNNKKNCLFRFVHGLGDTVQFRCVLKELKYFYPDCEFSVMSPNGTRDLFADLVKAWFPNNPTDLSMNWIDNLKYDRCHWVIFAHPQYDWNGVSTKVAQCLDDEFNLPTLTEFCTYDCTFQPEQEARVSEWVDALSASDGLFLIHYEGISGKQQKDLSPREIREFCRELRGRGFTPVILDWNPKGNEIVREGLAISPNSIWNHRAYAEVGELYCLLEKAVGALGIDSGVEHVWGCGTTPVFIVWRDHFPLYCYDLARNVTHLIPHPLPKDYEELKACPEVWDAFSRLYRSEAYSPMWGTDYFRPVLEWLDGK